MAKAVPGTTSTFAERITGGFYLSIEPDASNWPAPAWPWATCWM